MNEHDLRSALHQATDGCQLSEYQKNRILAGMKGEEPVKKKLSVSFVLVMIIALLTMSAAVALVHSTIADRLFGNSESAPKAVTDLIQTPQLTVENELGNLSLDEWYYDGQALHTAFTISNPTSDSLFYTLDGIYLNDHHVTYNRIRTEGAGDSGFLLGGSVSGTTMPQSVSLYNQGDELYQFDKNGKYAGRIPLPEGAVDLKIKVAVWRPLNAPALIDYKQYEGVNTSETTDRLVVDDTGFTQLWLLRPEKYNLHYTAAESGAQVYKEAYQDLGWMQLIDMIEIKISLDLSNGQVVRGIPEKDVFAMSDCQLTLEQFDFSHAGGKATLSLRGPEGNVKNLVSPHGIWLIDLEEDRLLSNGCYWNDQPDDTGALIISMELLPHADELPNVVYLAQAKQYHECSDPVSPNYDANLEKPASIIDGWEFDLSTAVAIPLHIMP